MGGGNLSLQVHPLTEYIQDSFGMHYTQDESYYLLDAAEDEETYVYLGVKNGVDRDAMAGDLKRAEKGEIPFPGGRVCEPGTGKETRSYSDPGGNHPLLRQKYHGAGDQRYPLYLYL